MAKMRKIRRVYVLCSFPNNSDLMGGMECFVIYPAIWLDALRSDVQHYVQVPP
jgi:hypothetical protein